MRAFILCDTAGVEFAAVGCPSADMLDAPAEGLQWVETTHPVNQYTVELVDGEFVPVLRVRSEATVFELAVSEARNRIKLARDVFEYSSFTWDGSRFDSNSASQARLMGLVSLAQMALATSTPFEIDWTLADNSTRTLSAMDALGIGQALGAHVQTAHVTARGLKALVAAATTIEEVDAIAWPSA